MNMNNITLTTLFPPQSIRTVLEKAKDRNTIPTEIPIEIEPLEGSRLYRVLPDIFEDNKIIYGFVTANPALDSHFFPISAGDYGKRYIIIRESANHFIVMFVSDDERKMNFLWFDKKDIIELLKDAYHPNLTYGSV